MCPWPPFADATMLPLLVRLLPPSTEANGYIASATRGAT